MKEYLVKGVTLPEAYHTALWKLHALGDFAPCPDYDTEMRECGMTLHVECPTWEPRISKLMPAGPRELEQYRQETGDQTVTLVASTASPFKFCDNVLGALGETEIAQGLDVLDQLSETSGLPAPVPLASLRSKKIRFTGVVEKENMVDAVLSMLE